jgi:SNF2 family DNA or RNA helicase
MGVSATLTAATNVIFYDDCWTPSDKEQCEDRAYRIGTTKSVNIYTLVSKGTIDEYVYKILEDKAAIAKFIVDDKLDLKRNPELFDFLLGRGNTK